MEKIANDGLVFDQGTILLLLLVIGAATLVLQFWNPMEMDVNAPAELGCIIELTGPWLTTEEPRYVGVGIHGCQGFEDTVALAGCPAASGIVTVTRGVYHGQSLSVVKKCRGLDQGESIAWYFP